MIIGQQQIELRERLQTELVDRCKRNPRYSLRSFARFLSIEPSALSKILKGKRRISEATHERLNQRLGWKPEIQGEYRDISLDFFEAISNWYHFAILELTSLKTFKSDSRWVAAKLGITSIEVDRAIETLQRIGFLKIDRRGNWKDVSGSVTTIKNAFTHAAFRKLQTQILNQALNALESIPLELREQSAMTMAIDSRKLDAAKERIKDFRRSLCAFLQSGERDSVYQLSISMFPVSKEAIRPKKKEQ